MNNFAFICGAPRSGTTLLANLLDSHDDVFLLPIETEILQYWNYHKTNNSLERFFLRDFLNTSDVLFFIDRATREQHEIYMRTRYKVKKFFQFNIIDKDIFIKTYLENINNIGLSLKGVYTAFFKAAMLLNKNNNDKKLLIEKRPLDNEMGAILLRDAFPDSKFLHIVRDPRTRYISSKMRRLYRPQRIFPRYTHNFNGENFAKVISEISMTSLMLAKLNKDVIGKDYEIVRFEDLLKNSEKEMKKVAGHLNIDFTENLLKQTSAGKKQVAMSSIDKAFSSGITDISDKRLKSFYKNTSYLERKILFLFTSEIAKHFNYDLETVEYISTTDIFKPLKFENPKDYLRTRLNMLKTLRGRSTLIGIRHFHTILDNFEKGIITQD
jgi:Sulfotransferase family